MTTLRYLLSTRNTGLTLPVAEGTTLRKDFIRSGSWRVKQDDGSIIRFNVSPDRIKRWEDTFKLMRQRGVTVPITVDHMEVRDPKTNEIIPVLLTPAMAEAKRGDVVNLFLDGDKGMFDCVPADAEAEKLMHRCPEVSLELTRDFEVGGHSYDEAITAITLTPKPVVPDQGKWQRLAASREQVDDGGAKIICLSAEPMQENVMDLNKLLASLRSTLGIGADVADEKVVEQVVGALTASKTALSRADHDAAVKPLNEQITKLSRDLDEAKKAQTVTTLGIDKMEVDEDAMAMATSAAETRINNLRFATPAQKALLLSRVKDPTMGKICLSRKVSRAAGLPAPMLDLLLEVFEKSNAAEMESLLKEQTGPQKKIEMSRGGDGPDATYDPEVTKRMVAKASGKSDSLVL